MPLLCPTLYAAWAKPFPIHPTSDTPGTGAAYVPAVGVPALRFAAPPPPPPPVPVARPAQLVVPAEAVEPAPAAELSADQTPAEKPAGHPPEPSPVAPAAIAPDDAAQRKKPAAPILPDDTPRRARPEDFLPFFQFPGQPGGPSDVTVITPGPSQPAAPAPLPTSSATYRQR